MKKQRKNFKRKLSKVCGKDELRPIFMHLYFKDGYVVGTNAHILVSQSLEKHCFTDQEIEILDGKFLHRDAFNVIYKQDNIYVTDEGFKCVNKNSVFTVPFSKNPGNFPDWKKVIPDLKIKDPLDKVVINLKLLKVLRKVLRKVKLSDLNNVKFLFSEKNKGIVIHPIDEDLTDADELILIMPVMVSY